MRRAALEGLIRRQKLAALGVLFVLAANTIAFCDAGYPLLSPAFAVVAALSVLGACMLAAPLCFHQASRAAVFAIGLTYFLDVTYIGGGPYTAALLVLLAGYVVYLVAWRGSETIVPFAATAVAVSTVFIVPQQAISNARLSPGSFTLVEPARQAAGRPYLHIVLDEMSPLALIPETPAYSGLRRRMIADYESRGFRLYDDTEAPAGSTHISLGHAFATRDAALHNYSEPDGFFSYALGENRLADRLIEAGYGVTALQNSYLEFCAAQEWRCLSYARSGDGAALNRRAASTKDAIGYALGDLNTVLVSGESVRSSVYYQAAGRLAAWFGAAVPSWRLYVARPPATLDMMDSATTALGSLERGQAAVLHLLLPHFPYVLDERCAMKNPAEVSAPRWVMRNTGGGFEPAKAERAYWQQAECTHDALMKLVDAALGSPAGKDALIVIHGDHGSRLYEKLAAPHLQEADDRTRRYALKTHFAVRGVDARAEALAGSARLRDRISVVLDAIGPQAEPDEGLITSATP